MKFKNSIRRGITFAAVAFMSGGILAACGGAGGNSGAATTSGSSETTTTAGTTTSGSSSASSDRSVLRFAGNGGQLMDPANAYNGWPTIRNGVAETLFKLDDAMEAQPYLAESFTLSDDKLTYEIKIKDGITFQNGKPCDAEAVKKSLQRTLDMNDRAPDDLLIASMEADGQTLKITTSSPNPALINNLTDPYACIIDADAGTNFEENPIGTGPYMVESFKEDVETILVPYDDYWQGKPGLSRLEVVAISDKDTMVAAMQSGDIDMAYGMSYEGQNMLKDNPAYKLLTTETSRVYKLYHNLNNKHLANANVRKAINMLVDKETYGSVVMNGFGAPAVGAFPENTIYGEGLTATEYNVDEAKKLLEQEGYTDSNGNGTIDKDGEELNFRIVTYSSRAELPLIAEALQAQFKEVGIESSVSISENISDDLKADLYDIAPYAFVTMPTGDPGSYIHSVFGTGGGNNFGHYSNAEVDELIKQLDAEFDTDKRGEITRKIVKHILDEDIMCFMDRLKMSIVTTDKVTGVTPHPSDYYQITYETTKTQ